MAVTKAELVNALSIFKEMIDADIENRFVQKDGAKVLSTNDFTDELKEKLDGIIDEDISREDIANLFDGGASGT